MRVILLGPPGSGKGTQGDLIENRYGLPKISSGDLLREAVRKETDLGKQAEVYMKRGDLVSDDLVIAEIRERIALPDCEGGFVLDGFPRTLPQARMLKEIDSAQREAVLDIQLADDVIIERLSARRVCLQCQSIYHLQAKPPEDVGRCDICGSSLVQREDDRPEVIRRRLEVYREQTLPLVDFYQGKNVYNAVAGDGGVEDVFQRVSDILQRILPKSASGGSVG